MLTNQSDDGLNNSCGVDLLLTKQTNSLIFWLKKINIMSDCQNKTIRISIVTSVLSAGLRRPSLYPLEKGKITPPHKYGVQWI